MAERESGLPVDPRSILDQADQALAAALRSRFEEIGIDAQKLNAQTFQAVALRTLFELQRGGAITFHPALLIPRIPRLAGQFIGPDAARKVQLDITNAITGEL